MLCPIAYHAKKRPSALALITPTQSLTYRECDQLIDEIPVLQLFAHLRKNKPYCPINPKLPESIQQAQRAALSGVSGFATCLFTSGSSGTPKIACHTFENHFYSALGSNLYIPLSPGDLWLLTLPLHHIAGIALLFRSFIAGITVVLPGSNVRSTHVSLVPTQLKRLTKKERDSFKVILLGGAPIPEELITDNVYATYGMTEMSSQVITKKRLHPFAEKKIENGEILLKGKTLFAGYFSKEALIKPFDQEGWFHTGDLTDGKTIWRKDRLIISGGENIQPEEIERALLSIKGITGARVVSIHHPEWGERPLAYITKDQPLKIELIYELLSTTLPKYKIPDQILEDPSLSSKCFNGDGSSIL
jgi:O-succinylbenzoic acid--CoA ligase